MIATISVISIPYAEVQHTRSHIVRFQGYANAKQISQVQHVPCSPFHRPADQAVLLPHCPKHQ